EDIGAGFEIRRIGVLGNVVRQAVVARHEDHAGGADAGEHLRVVPRARRYAPYRVTEVAGRLLDERDDAFVELDGLEARGRAGRDLHTLLAFDVVDRVGEQLLGALERRLVGVAQVDRHDGARGDDVDEIG